MRLKVFVTILLTIVLTAVLSPEMARATFQSPIPQSPLPIPQTGAYKVYIVVLFMRADENPVQPYNPIMCDYNDPRRGTLYRDLLDGTATFLAPFAAWSSEACECGLGTADALGTAMGTIVGRVFRIVKLIFGIVWDVLSATLGLITQLLAIFFGAATAPAINCTGNAEGICVGMAMIFSIDNTVGGVLTMIVLIAVSTLGIYLAMYVIRDVREIMQPSGSDD